MKYEYLCNISVAFTDPGGGGVLDLYLGREVLPGP